MPWAKLTTQPEPSVAERFTGPPAWTAQPLAAALPKHGPPPPPPPRASKPAASPRDPPQASPAQPTHARQRAWASASPERNSLEVRDVDLQQGSHSSSLFSQSIVPPLDRPGANAACSSAQGKDDRMPAAQALRADSTQVRSSFKLQATPDLHCPTFVMCLL